MDPDNDSGRQVSLITSGSATQELLDNDPDNIFLFRYPLNIRGSEKDPNKVILDYDPSKLGAKFLTTLRRLIGSVRGVLNDVHTKPLVFDANNLAVRLQV